jgi:hypothetical protein
MDAAHRPDPLAGHHPLAGCHDGSHRLVLGADAVRVYQHHHAPTGHRPGEADHPIAGGHHRTALGSGEIHP